MKNNIIPFLFIFLLIVQTGYSILSSADLYNKANEYYSLKDYQNALKLYSELIERGVKNHKLYYNMGNTYSKLNRIGYSVLYFEKALLLKPFDRDTRENLEYVKRSLKDRIVPLYNGGFFKIIRTLLSYINLRITIYTEMIIFTLLIIFINLYIFFPFKRSKLKRFIFIISLLFIISFTLTFSYRSYTKRKPRGIIVKEEIKVKDAPITESNTLFILHEGTEIKLIENRGEWIRLSLADGRQGWTSKDSAELLVL